MGALPETKETKPDFRPAEEYDDVEVPVAFDSRTAWPACKMIGHIRDQSTCGSCWAFGGVEAMSDRVCIASNGTVQVELSTEDMLSCCGFTCGSGCNGGYPSSAWRFFKKHGLTTEDKYPYAFPPCEVRRSLPVLVRGNATLRCNLSMLAHLPARALLAALPAALGLLCVALTCRLPS